MEGAVATMLSNACLVLRRDRPHIVRISNLSCSASTLFPFSHIEWLVVDFAFALFCSRGVVLLSDLGHACPTVSVALATRK